MSRVTHTNASAYTPLNKEAADSARRLLQYCQLPDQKKFTRDISRDIWKKNSQQLKIFVYPAISRWAPNVVLVGKEWSDIGGCENVRQEIYG